MEDVANNVVSPDTKHFMFSERAPYRTYAGNVPHVFIDRENDDGTFDVTAWNLIGPGSDDQIKNVPAEFIVEGKE